jgi:hypothetical protein
LQIPIDQSIKNLPDVPYTISYVLRKRLQIDNLSELPKEKRPTEEIIWEGSSEELDDWLGRVLNRKNTDNTELVISEIEG